MERLQLSGLLLCRPLSLDTPQVVDNMLQQTFHLHHPAVRVKSHFH